MVYNRFRAGVVIRVLLITGVVGLLVLVFVLKHWYVTGFCLLLTLTGLLFDLIFYVERTNRELARFLTAIRHSDFTQRFTGAQHNSSFYELHKNFNAIMQAFQSIKAEKEAHYNYLQAIVENIRIGVMAFDETREVQLFNKVAKELLQVPFIKHLQALERISPELVTAATELENSQSKLVKINKGKEELLLVVSVSCFISQQKNIRIVSLQNIHSEMEEQELEAWQKLISVLTHEIMNSVTPIISLTSTIKSLVDERVETLYSAEQIEADENLDDIRTGLQTIEKRSTGMLRFVQNYRRLTRVPPPHLEVVNLATLFAHIRKLLQHEQAYKTVPLSFSVAEPELLITADSELIEQVLLNLIKNAAEACEHAANPHVTIAAYAAGEAGNQVFIEVKDNGSGIPDEIMDKIFVPFYTTKKQGSGIGLSLSRQIMRLHQGSIRVHKTPEMETVFSLVFNK